jgi:hypothetical protein
MGKRRDRFDRRQVDQALSRSVNGPLKVKERARRRARMIESLKKGSMPYTRPVRSWLCRELGKKERQITPADVQKLIRGG